MAYRFHVRIRRYRSAGSSAAYRRAAQQGAQLRAQLDAQDPRFAEARAAELAALRAIGDAHRAAAAAAAPVPPLPPTGQPSRCWACGFPIPDSQYATGCPSCCRSFLD